MKKELIYKISMLKGLLATMNGHFERNTLEHTHILVKECLNLTWELEELSGLTLSDREKEVVGYVVEGLSNQEIAEKMMVVEKTIKFHLTTIYRKLGIKTRSQLIVEHYKNALIAAESDKQVLQEKVQQLSI